jgi:hypothetical protein
VEVDHERPSPARGEAAVEETDVVRELGDFRRAPRLLLRGESDPLCVGPRTSLGEPWRAASIETRKERAGENASERDNGGE